MEDVKLIIKISKEDYETIKKDTKEFFSKPGHKVPTLYKAVVEGIPLPKEHGYKAEVITCGNCMMCGKELTEGLFFCKECEEIIDVERRNKK